MYLIVIKKVRVAGYYHYIFLTFSPQLHMSIYTYTREFSDTKIFQRLVRLVAADNCHRERKIQLKLHTCLFINIFILLYLFTFFFLVKKIKSYF